MACKNRKKLITFIFCSAGCSLLRAEGFPCSLDVLFMYLRAVLCTFQISVDFYYVPVEGGGGARERGIECIMYGYSKCVNCTRGYS
jgi:hypothetical protein